MFSSINIIISKHKQEFYFLIRIKNYILFTLHKTINTTVQFPKKNIKV